MAVSPSTVLYIDGQNFLARIRSILRRRGVASVDITKFDFWGLLNHVFRDQQVDLAAFYFAKLHADKETEEKSKELLEREEVLRKELESKGFKYVTAGSVRRRGRGEEIEFQEKGVDVSIAVDIVTDVLSGGVKLVLLASSDSDLQPAVRAAKEHGAKVWYIGFRSRMNRGLMLSTDRYVLISNDDVARFYPETAGAKRQEAPLSTPAQGPKGRPPELKSQSDHTDFNEPPWRN